jgi:hypothetical protein
VCRHDHVLFELFFGDSLTRASHASGECVDSLLPVVCVLDVISSVRSATHKATRRGICAVVLLLAVLKIQLGH